MPAGDGFTVRCISSLPPTLAVTRGYCPLCGPGHPGWRFSSETASSSSYTQVAKALGIYNGTAKTSISKRIGVLGLDTSHFHRSVIAAPAPNHRACVARPARSAFAPCVGHRGIEPRNTALSGRPRRPAGSWPAESGGADPGHPPYEGGAAAVRGGKAAGQGLEPRFAASETAVLPLDDPALVRAGRVDLPRDRVWAGQVCHFPSRPRTPPRTRTENPLIKIQLLFLGASGAPSLTRGLNAAHQLGRLAHRRNACEAQWVTHHGCVGIAGFEPAISATRTRRP
jgi:hypothetical protein